MTVLDQAATTTHDQAMMIGMTTLVPDLVEVVLPLGLEPLGSMPLVLEVLLSRQAPQTFVLALNLDLVRVAMPLVLEVLLSRQAPQTLFALALLLDLVRAAMPLVLEVLLNHHAPQTLIVLAPPL